MITHEFPFSIAYADTDAGGIVYHGRYIEIAERARMDWLRGITFPDGDIGLVIRRLHVEYLRPLKLWDDFVVHSTVIESGAATMTVEQKFIKDDFVHAIVTVSVAYLGADMRPHRIPDEMRARCE